MTTPPAGFARVSVIVPCRNEERHIARCLNSILASDYPSERLEVLVVDGRSEDGTRAILDDYVARHPTIRVLDNPRRIQPVAVNIGIRAARGEILMRLDAHTVYPKTYIRNLVTALQESGADNVGGVLVTVPANDTVVARAIAIAMSHRFGVGNSYFRVGVREPRWVETIAFFCCRRETFERIGLFDEELADEDSEFNARLIRHGGRILLVPNVFCRYHARGSFRQAARLYYQYGHSKPLAARKLGRVMTLRQLVPPVFLLTLAASAILSPWVDLARVVLGATLLPYGLAVVGCSLLAGREAGLRTSAALALAFPTLHLSFGLGFLSAALGLALRPATQPGGTGHPPALDGELPTR